MCAVPAGVLTYLSPVSGALKGTAERVIYLGGPERVEPVALCGIGVNG